MWVAVTGSVGVCKNKVIEYLTTLKKYDHRSLGDPCKRLTRLSEELDWMGNRILLQQSFERDIDRANIVTNRSAWDSLMFVNVAYKLKEISEEDYEAFRVVYDKFTQELTPPHMVIYLKSNYINATNRMQLQGESPNMDFVVALTKEYEEIMPWVRVPVIEIDVEERIDPVLEEVQYGLDNLSTTKLDLKSVWDRTFFKPGFITGGNSGEKD